MNDKKRRRERYEILLEKLSYKIDLILKLHKELGKKFDEAKRERQVLRNDLIKKMELLVIAINKNFVK